MQYWSINSATCSHPSLAAGTGKNQYRQYSPYCHDIQCFIGSPPEASWTQGYQSAHLRCSWIDTSSQSCWLWTARVLAMLVGTWSWPQCLDRSFEPMQSMPHSSIRSLKNKKWSINHSNGFVEFSGVQKFEVTQVTLKPRHVLLCFPGFLGRRSDSSRRVWCSSLSIRDSFTHRCAAVDPCH